MSKAGERLYNGIIKENPTFVLMLGMCPTLAVTTSAMNGLGMGLTTTVILAMSNLMISALRKVIPNGRGKRLKIMLPDQTGSSLLHQSKVRSRKKMSLISGMEYIINRSRADIVFVSISTDSEIRTETSGNR